MFTPKRPSSLRRLPCWLSVTAATALVVGSTTTGATAMANGDPEGIAVAEVVISAPGSASNERPAEDSRSHHQGTRCRCGVRCH